MRNGRVADKNSSLPRAGLARALAPVVAVASVVDGVFDVMQRPVGGDAVPLGQVRQFRERFGYQLMDAAAAPLAAVRAPFFAAAACTICRGVTEMPWP